MQHLLSAPTASRQQQRADIRNPVRHLVHGRQRRAAVPGNDRAHLRRAGQAASGCCSFRRFSFDLRSTHCSQLERTAVTRHGRRSVPPAEPRRGTLQAAAGGRIISPFCGPDDCAGRKQRRAVTAASKPTASRPRHLQRHTNTNVPGSLPAPATTISIFSVTAEADADTASPSELCARADSRRPPARYSWPAVAAVPAASAPAAASCPGSTIYLPASQWPWSLPETADGQRQWRSERLLWTRTRAHPPARRCPRRYCRQPSPASRRTSGQVADEGDDHGAYARGPVHRRRVARILRTHGPTDLVDHYRPFLLIFFGSLGKI